MPDIEKVTIENAAEKLKGRIREAFIELLTPEQFNDMVQAELRRFTQDQTIPGQYGNSARTEPSGFSTLCREVFAERVKFELKTLLNSQEYQGLWGTEGIGISTAVQIWLTQNSAALIESMVMALAGKAAQSMLENLRSRI